MAIIVDANLVTVMVSGDSRGEKVAGQFETWITQAIPLHAPELAKYEIANALTRLIVAENFNAEALDDAWETIQTLPITYHSMSALPQVVRIARSLSRQNAYDAAYIALAESLQAELWTLDSPLYRNATAKGFSVYLSFRCI